MIMKKQFLNYHGPISGKPVVNFFIPRVNSIGAGRIIYISYQFPGTPIHDSAPQGQDRGTPSPGCCSIFWFLSSSGRMDRCWGRGLLYNNFPVELDRLIISSVLWK